MSDDVEESDVDHDGPGVPMLHGVAMTTTRGQIVLHPDVASYHDLAAELRAEGYRMCIDVTVVDYLGAPPRPLPPGIIAERFELVAQFLDLEAHRRLRLRVQVGEATSVPTITDLFPGAEALEREAWDMFGVVFDDHPDLTRILMPEEWTGHPLRKDYDVGRIPVQFKATS